MASIKDLKHQLGSLHDKMTAMTAKVDAESRQMTQEEEAQWNLMDADFEKIKADVDRRERMESHQAQMEGRVTVPPIENRVQNLNDPFAKLSTEEREQKVNQAFSQFVRYGIEGMAQENRAIMNARRATEDGNLLPYEIRAAQTVTTTAGGYLIPTGFSGKLEEQLKSFGGMREVATIMPTPDGRQIPWPTLDDTSNVGEIIAINSAHNAQDLAFSQVLFGSFKYSSKIVLVPVELLQDSFFDVDSLLAKSLATRIGRITNTHFTSGTDTTQPKGVVAEAGLGKTGANGQTTSVTYTDLVDLEHSLDPSYRLNARFMFADSTLKALKKLVDGSNRPLWQPALSGLGTSAPSNLLGYPYVINQDIDTMAASKKSILFGDFSKYVIRDCRDVTLMRLVERYAEYSQVGFLAFSRHDGRAVQGAAGGAIKYYINSAT